MEAFAVEAAKAEQSWLDLFEKYKKEYKDLADEWDKWQQKGAR